MRFWPHVWLLIPALVCGAAEPPANRFHEASTNRPLLLYIGTYTGGRSQGIYRARFDLAAGKLSQPALAAETRNPSFLAVHPDHNVLYAVGESAGADGKPAGGVSAFRIEGADGHLTLLNRQSSGGAGPCHVSVDRTGQCVLVANYGGGSIAALPLQADGGLQPAGTIIQHQGSSLNPERQAGPHAHFIQVSPDNRLALACDLGLDKILIYRLDPARAVLTPNDPPAGLVVAGSGPRHFAFHPNGRWLYVINEMGGTITAFDFDAARGALKERQTVSTLPAGFKGENTCAEIQAHPSGKFLYASNRGDDSLVVYALDPRTGQLTWVQRQSSQGKTPRHFALLPGGRWLLAEHQTTENITVFRVDEPSGRLSFTGQSVEVGKPVCVEFVPGR